MLRKTLVLLFLLLAFCPRGSASPAIAAGGDDTLWPQWEGFRDRFLSEGGRVIDRGTPQLQTTSEGQSYALFFALVANDRAAFDRILRWTEDNLAGGDLTARLPAWQWGRHDDGTWGVIDDNAAADSDLWIAYVLGEAGRLWKNPQYSALGELLAARILREETAELPGWGRTLLPGPVGFHPTADLWRLNPSYVPLQLIRRMATLYPSSDWYRLVETSVALIRNSAPHGFVPEWIIYKTKSGFLPDSDAVGAGNFNAIRVYLWAGMLANSDPLQPVLLKTLAPMARYVSTTGTPPLQTDATDGVVSGNGPGGFSAALLPFLAASKLPEALRQQRLRVTAKMSLEGADNYYEQVLTLFGLGWIENRFRFTRNGSLVPQWSCTQNSSSSR